MTDSTGNTTQKVQEKTVSLKDLAVRLGAELKGDPAVLIRGVADLEHAGPDELSFLTDDRYLPFLGGCRAAALIVPPSHEHLGFSLLICRQPHVAMARAAQLFWEPPCLPPGVHSSAHVEGDALLGDGAAVGPLAHIGAGCRIGRDVRIYGGAYLGRNVRVGDGCCIHPSVTILDGCTLGNRVVIHSGTVIGADGFGYAQDEQGRHVKIPQAGTVQIDDDVEIGANTTIDRATFGRTWIQSGAKIDNLVMVAHNVVVGKHALLIAQAGVSGSVRIGNHAILAGNCGIAGHIQIGDRARVGAMSGVFRSVGDDEVVIGAPAFPARQYWRTLSHVQHLQEYKKELADLRDRVRKLEEALKGD